MEKPWLTKGIVRAINKKNRLYQRFLKHRTKSAENQYKTYKNKLISIIRQNKKVYYHNLLEQHKNNIQETWKVLNCLIKKHAVRENYSNFFVRNDQIIDDTKEIAN